VKSPSEILFNYQIKEVFKKIREKKMDFPCYAGWLAEEKIVNWLYTKYIFQCLKIKNMQYKFSIVFFHPSAWLAGVRTKMKIIFF
jgi:hypothetical protein